MSFNNINNEEIKKFIDLLMLISKNEKLLDIIYNIIDVY